MKHSDKRKYQSNNMKVMMHVCEIACVRECVYVYECVCVCLLMHLCVCVYAKILCVFSTMR